MVVHLAAPRPEVHVNLGAAAGYVIGTHGATLRKLHQETGATLRMVDRKKRSASPVLRIRGTDKQRREALEHVQRLVYRHNGRPRAPVQRRSKYLHSATKTTRTGASL